MVSSNSSVTPLMTASIDMIHRLGSTSWQLRYQDDEEPVIWMAAAGFQRDGKEVFEVDAGLSPERATFRLLERLADGGQCQHCQRPTGVTEDFEGNMPADELVCWYRYDPELKTFRRGCEGDAPRDDPRPCKECGASKAEHLKQYLGHAFKPDKRIRP